MKTLRTTLVALVIAFGSTVTFTGCFINADEEIYDQLERGNNDSAGKDSNDDQWD